MAQKLHDTYHFSYDTLKVLLGGWNSWKDNNSKDPNAYPIVVSTSGAATPTSSNPQQIVLTPALAPPVPTTAP